MLKSKSLPILAGAAGLLLVGGIALPTPSHAAVFDVTSDNIGVACSPNCGTITVTDNGSGKYTFDVDLSSALVLHSVQSGSTRDVGFNLTGASIDAASTDVNSLATNVMFDGFGTFDSAVRCTNVTAGNICNPNGQSPSNDLIFTIDATSGQALTGTFIGLDVAQASNTSNTGFASGTLAVPAPVIGHGLFVLLAVGGVLFGGKLFESLNMRRSLAT
jgi:hypothetical protein